LLSRQTGAGTKGLPSNLCEICSHRKDVCLLAEFERGMIRERVNAGLARARAKGTKLGRRPVRPAIEECIREPRAEGMGILKIGRTIIGVGTSVVQRVLVTAEIESQQARSLSRARAIS
jgi:DNA invertase Pin-like site-specific DNA recombinase